MRIAVDFSQYGGPLSRETITCWKDEGVERAIVQYSALMPVHLDALVGSGLEVEAYVYLYWGTDPWGQTPQLRTRNALAMAGGRIKRLWLDAEDSEHAYREDQLLECVAICEAAGMPTGIYTGRWWWLPRTGNSQAFAHLPLWHAEYLVGGAEANPDFGQRVNFDFFTPYGGWSTPEIWQYQNTCSLCGHSVDMNALEEVAQPADPTLIYIPGLDGQHRVGAYLVTYNAGVPVLRVGGSLPGQLAKNYGNAWVWLRNDNGRAFWSSEEGD